MAPTVDTRSLKEKILANIKIDENDCWVWQQRLTRGYGNLKIPGQRAQRRVHRVAYEEFVGPIPPGLDIDHLCRNRACVNPDHLEPVTRAENVLRGHGITARQARQTHCKYGHEFTPENTIIRADGSRNCRTCRPLKRKRIAAALAAAGGGDRHE